MYSRAPMIAIVGNEKKKMYSRAPMIVGNEKKKCAQERVLCTESPLTFRRRNQITAESHVHILMAESDIYVARIAHRLTVKLGPLFDMPGALLPKEPDWRLATAGKDYAVWERVQGIPPEDTAAVADGQDQDFNVDEIDEQVAYYNSQQQDEQQQQQTPEGFHGKGFQGEGGGSSGMDGEGRPVLLGGDPVTEDPPSIGSFYEEPPAEEEEEGQQAADEQQWM